MTTKAQLVEEILSIKAIDTKSNLMKKSLSQLQSLLTELEDEMVSETTADTNQAPATPQIDVQALMEQMKREMLAELKAQARQEVEAELKAEQATTDEPVSVAKVPNKKVEVDRFELIPVMNITNGSLIFTSRKTGAEWNWSEYGDIEYMEFQELLTMRSAHRRFFDEPFILVMHDDAVEHLGLTKMYDSMKHPDRIDEVFNLNQQDFEEVLDKSPRGIKHLIISRARTLYAQEKLDSARKIKYMNEKYQAEIGQRG